MKEPTVSVVIPVLNEIDHISECIESVIRENPHEVIVVDGGSTDGTPEAVSGIRDVKVITVTPPGRGKQMNAGANEASGNILLFLHGDSKLPEGWKMALLSALEKKPDAAGGCFLVSLSGEGIVYRVTEFMINLRTITLKRFTGDQGIFVKKDFFDEIGGYPDVPIMEDVIMADRMRERGICVLSERVITSSRRWEKWGALKTILLMWETKLLFRLGRKPEELAEYYYKGKFTPIFRIK